MKFMQVHTFYEQYLKDHYTGHPGLDDKPSLEQTEQLLEDGFAASHMFTPYMSGHGYQTRLVIANNIFAQGKWLRENGVTLDNVEDWLHEVVIRQVNEYRPDVLYLTDPINFDAKFLNRLSFKPKLVLGWRAAEIPRSTDWSGFDLIISNYNLALEIAPKLGAKESAFFMPGFPGRVAGQVAQQPKAYDVVFTGQLSISHARRYAILNEVAKLPPQDGRPLSLAYYIGNRHDPKAGAYSCDKGAVWGMDMFRALAGGKIVLNSHIDIANGQVGNMRLFEGTGVGSLMLTDYEDELSRYFEPGREVETYRSMGELAEKIYYYRDHDQEREAIALRGQERCLRDYSMEKRAGELAALLSKHLEMKGIGMKASEMKGSPAAPGTSPVAALKARAEQMLESGDVEAAFTLLIEAKALKQPAQGLDQLRACCFLRMDQPLGAVEALREELRFFPGNREAAQMLELLERQIPAGAYGSCGADSAEFRELLQAIRPYTMLSEQRLFSLYSHARSVCENDLPGNFVECGVAAGGSSALLAWVLKKYSRQPRRLFSFDSFSGMPKPSQFDSHQGIGAESTGWGTGTCAAPEASLLEICRKLGVDDAVTPVKGYFEATLPVMRDWVGMVAFLHLDGDWYDSTKAILENLYDRLMNNAILQVDDYGYWDGCRKAIHEFEAGRGVSFAINPIDATGVWFAKPDLFPENRSLARALVEDFHRDDPAPKGVTSQMSANERFQLYYALREEVPATSGLLRFIEIGSYSGASLLLTHQALQRRGARFQGISVEPGGTDQFHEIVKILAEDVIHLPLFSHEAAARLQAMVEPERLPQVIFVDGDHSYQGVRQDILDFYPLLAPGGVMLFHDYLPELNEENRAAIEHHHGGEPGIRRACQELMETEYGCQSIELPLLYPTDPTQTQAQLPIIPGVFSTVRAYRKPARETSHA
jgi:hypothetical protein